MKLLKIVLVDDDPIFTLLFQRILEQYPDGPVEFEKFPDGYNAVEFFRENKNSPDSYPNILFIDINMPLMNGWELIKTINEEKLFGSKKIKIYVVTSSISKIDLENSNLQIDPIGYLIKPISHQKIFEVLKEETSEFD